VEDAQVLLRRPLRLLFEQQIVGQAEATGGEQVGPVTVVGERPRLPHQPVDDVPVLDVVLAPTPQPGEPLDAALGVPDLDLLRIDAGLDLLADQPARHRIGVPRDVNGAALIHAYLPPLARFQPTSRQLPQQRQLLRQSRLPVRIELLEVPSQECLVGGPAGEVAAAPQEQRLLQRSFELAMALFGVAVLVGVTGLDGLALQTVVPQQGLVSLREGRSLGPRWHGRRQPVGAMQQRHAAQFPEGILQAFAEALIALGETDRACLPVRVRQHEVVDQVVERRAEDGHPQLGAVREVTGTQPSRRMDLVEEDLLGLAVQGPPGLDPPLQSAELVVGEATGKAALQVGEQGLGLQTGVQLQQGFELRPDIGERVRPGPPIAAHAFDLRRQPTEPAILTSRLGAQASLGSCQILGQSLSVETAEPPDLLVLNHRKPSWKRASDDVGRQNDPEF
jgi:hypothetical protein